MTRKCKKGSYMALFTLVVIAAVIVLNLIVGKLPAKYLKHDLSSNQILTLGDTTRDILAQLDRDVTIHIVADPNSVDERITSFVNLYKDLSPHISVEANDPVLHPDVLTSLDTEPGNLIVSCESTGKKTSISFGDTAAAVYTLTGHGETALSSAVSDAMDKSGMKAADLNLLTQGSVPQDCSLLIMNAPVKDISADEKETLTDYLKNGGRMLLLAGCTQDTLSNLTDFISQYGMDLKNGFVADPAPQHYYNNNPFNVIPDYDFASSLLSGIDSSAAALLVQPAGMTIQENPSEDIAVQPFLTTSDSAFLVDPATQEKTQGTYVLGAVATETVNEEEGTSSMLTVITAPSMIDDSILSRFPSITNLTLFMNAAASGLPGVTPLSIPSKSLDITYNMVTSAGLWSALFIIVIPVIFLIAGFVIWLKRRKL